MNAQTSFQFAAMIAGMAAFSIAAMWRVTGTNQGERVRQITIGAVCSVFMLAVLFLLVSVIIKP